MLLPLYSFNQTETSCHFGKTTFLANLLKLLKLKTCNSAIARWESNQPSTTLFPFPGPCQNILTLNSSHQDEVLFWFKLLTYAEGRMAVPNRMNFRKNSKRPSTLPPSFVENYVAIFYNEYGRIYVRRYESQIVWNACTWSPEIETILSRGGHTQLFQS